MSNRIITWYCIRSNPVSVCLLCVRVNWPSGGPYSRMKHCPVGPLPVVFWGVGGHQCCSVKNAYRRGTGVKFSLQTETLAVKKQEILRLATSLRSALQLSSAHTLLAV